MKKFGFIAVALLLAGTHQAALAQRGKAAAKPAAAAKPSAAAPAAAGSDGLTADEKDHAIQDFGVMSSAMRSDKVPDEVKSALMGCIYSNPLSTISNAIDGVIKDNPGKVDRANPDQVLGVMAVVCGYQPPAQPAAGTPAPAPSGAAPAVGPAPGR